MITNQRGFNLTELMVVVAIMGIMGLIAVPTLVTALPGYRLKSSARELCSNMRKARSLAVKQNRNVSIAFNAGTKTYSIDGGTPAELPDGISFGCGNAPQDVPGNSPPSDGNTFNNEVIFTTQGLTSGAESGYVYLQNSKGQAYGVGVRASGSIVLRQWNGTVWK